MQTVNGKVRLVGNDGVLSLAQLEIHERSGTLTGNSVATVTTDANGDFSFQLKVGTYSLRYGADSIPFRVRETAGTTTFDTLVEVQ